MNLEWNEHGIAFILMIALTQVLVPLVANFIISSCFVSGLRR
jgi:hypothetical protein